MIENLKIKRALLRIGRATVDDLARAAGANDSTVRNFLADHDLCTKDVARGSGRGRPRTVWTLTDEGRQWLVADLSRFASLSDPELDQERLATLDRIRRSLGEVEDQIDDLEAVETPAEEIGPAKERLVAFCRALETGLGRLGEWRNVDDEKRRMARATARLDILKIRRDAAERAVVAAEKALSDSVVTWTRQFAQDIKEKSAGFSEEDVFVPDVVEASPFLVIDAARNSLASQCVFEVARTCRAPVLRVPIGEAHASGQIFLFETIAGRMAEVVGMMVRVVVTFDTRHIGSLDLVDSLARQASERWVHSSNVEIEPAVRILDNSVLMAAHVAKLTSVLAAPAGRPAAPLDDDVCRLAGALLRSPGTSDPLLPPYFVDAAEPSIAHEGGRWGVKHAVSEMLTISIVRRQAKRAAGTDQELGGASITPESAAPAVSLALWPSLWIS